MMSSWLRDLAHEPCYAQRDLQEIEDHLRESVSALQGSGLSPQEAFLVARRRLGDQAALDAEFTKVNGSSVWLNRLLWMFVGIQLWAVAWDLGGFARLAVTQGLLRAGMFPAGGWIGPNGWLQSLPSAALIALLQVGVLATGLWVCAWWMRTHRASLYEGVRRVLDRPATAVVALIVFGLALKAGIAFWNNTIYHGMPVQQVGAMAMSSSMGWSLISLGQILTVPILIVLLARRVRSQRPY
jgi:hypothetical protein